MNPKKDGLAELLEVFSYEFGSYATIDFNPFGTYSPSWSSFWQGKAFVPVNTGEIGFAVSEPLVSPEACGYLAFGPSGELLVDQSSELHRATERGRHPSLR